MLLAGGPGTPIPVSEPFFDAVSGLPEERLVLAGFAYVTSQGIRHLVRDPRGRRWTDLAASRWIVGIDQGTTEPAALEVLRSLQRSEVRVYSPTGNISKDSLTTRPHFHAKTLFAKSTSSPAAHLVVGSANVTGAALWNLPTNFELGLMVGTATGLDPASKGAFEHWWNLAWRQSLPLTDGLMRDYERIRGEFRALNPGVTEMENPARVFHPSDAQSFWIETREMTGGARNQVEFGREISGFLGPPHSSNQVELVHGAEVFARRSHRTRITDPPFGVRIALLYLPTRLGGAAADYKFKVVHLRRLDPATDGRARFELAVVGQHDRAAEEWRKKSVRSGLTGKTRGGRAWGCY